MKKKIKLLNWLIAPAISLPLFAISCQKSHDGEDKEDKKFRDPNIKNNNKTFIMKNDQTKEIQNIYNTELTELFNLVKENYRNYRVAYVPLKRSWDILSNKIKKLAREQTVEENRNIVWDFYQGWLSKNSELMKDNELAIYLYKYNLVFQDVDSVLVDTNLSFENNEFLEHLKIVDDRLSGVDITLGEMQKSLLALWTFLISYIFNEAKLTKFESLQNINIEADKNSHSHSHAIINLTYEMGLWHDALQAKKNNGLESLNEQYLQAKSHIVDNVDKIEYNNNYKEVIRVLNINGAWNDRYNLINKKFQTQAMEILNKIKKIIINIAKSQGIDKNLKLD
ncbi:HxHSH motif-containing lipoprotein [Metamycoplasma spumans]|uniref:HxHSH motif-containing lipoprotein n=1 Tax=Metamycoplasma spumans TaxID=92406 RepID=UPI0034DD5826